MTFISRMRIIQKTVWIPGKINENYADNGYDENKHLSLSCSQLFAETIISAQIFLKYYLSTSSKQLLKKLSNKNAGNGCTHWAIIIWPSKRWKTKWQKRNYSAIISRDLSVIPLLLFL